MAMHTRSDGEPHGRLLLVDADDASARLVTETLGQSLGGSLRITTASGGRPAAELLRDGDFDIILADLSSLRDLSERSDDAVARLVRLADGALVVALQARRESASELVREHIDWALAQADPVRSS